MRFDANVTNQDKLNEYKVFIDICKFHVTKVPNGHHKIQVYTIFDVKHDSRHRDRVNADCNLTEVLTESV